VSLTYSIKAFRHRFNHNQCVSTLMNLNNISVFIMLLFLMTNVGMLIYYSFVTYKIFIHTDSATKILLANEVLTRGELLPDGWYYVNNDVWIFLNHIFLVPLIKLFGLNYLSYALNNLLFYFIYWASIYFFLRKLKISVPGKLLIAILAISSLSFAYADNFGQIAYIPPYTFVFLILGLMNRIFVAKSDKILKWYLGVFLIIFIFGIHNPQRAFIYNLLPVLFVASYLYFTKKDQNIGYIIISLVSGVSFVLSTVFYYVVIIKDINFVKGANSLCFANYDSFLRNISVFFAGLFNTFGLFGRAQISPFSFDGVCILSNFVFFALLLYSLVKIRTYFDKTNKEIFIVYLILVFYLSVTLFLYLFTVPLAHDVMTFRYFYPAVLSAFIVLGLFISVVKWNEFLKTVAILFLVSFLSLSNYALYVKPSFANNLNRHERLGSYLSENDLTYGFASYWHSYVTTVFAKNSALVAPIYLSFFDPMRWLSSEHWYHRYDVDKTFIVFTNTEFKQYYDGIANKIGQKADRIDNVDGFKVAIFNMNIAKQLNRASKH